MSCHHVILYRELSQIMSAFIEAKNEDAEAGYLYRNKSDSFNKLTTQYTVLNATIIETSDEIAKLEAMLIEKKSKLSNLNFEFSNIKELLPTEKDIVTVMYYMYANFIFHIYIGYVHRICN